MNSISDKPVKPRKQVEPRKQVKPSKPVNLRITSAVLYHRFLRWFSHFVHGLKCIDLDLHLLLPRCDCERLSQRYRFPPRQKEAIIKPTADFHLFCGPSVRPVEGFGPIWCRKLSFCTAPVELARAIIFCDS